MDAEEEDELRYLSFVSRLIRYAITINIFFSSKHVVLHEWIGRLPQPFLLENNQKYVNAVLYFYSTIFIC